MTSTERRRALRLTVNEQSLVPGSPAAQDNGLGTEEAAATQAPTTRGPQRNAAATPVKPDSTGSIVHIIRSPFFPVSSSVDEMVRYRVYYVLFDAQR